MGKNILMLCYYYPPLTDVGCKRSIAFSKYFKKYGWNPCVLSVKNPDKSYCSIGTENAPNGVTTEFSYSLINIYWLISILHTVLLRIFRLVKVDIKKNYLYLMFCIPDHFGGWIPHTTIKGLNLIKRFQADVIYVSCSPVSAAIIGIILKYLTDKPLVLDFRDPYAVKSVSTILNIPKFRSKIEQGIMSFYIRHTDLFIVNNEDTKKEYIQEYPYVKDKIFSVHNGFDDEYMIQKKLEKYSKFTIVYTGDFYFWGLESASFFKAINLLNEKGKITKDSFQFLFYGDGKSEIEKIAEANDIKDLVIANNRIPYKDVLELILKSHLQLLRIVKPMISTKLFEGIPLNIPFLATIPDGEVKRIINRYSPSSYVVTEESAEKIADAINDAMFKYKNNQILDNNIQEFLANFSRESLTLKLINLIEQNLLQPRFDNRQGKLC
jgi:glycosyltransferase involved in cell wall biosynthesis